MSDPSLSSALMPEISRFYGIAIAIFYNESRHDGRPHFHATYGDHDASIDIHTLEVLAGDLPARGLQLTRRWAALHRSELLADWDLARRHQPLHAIDPLP